LACVILIPYTTLFRSVELTLSDDTGERVLVFSGDLGNPETSLMPHYETLERADLVLMESTYGARDHRPMDETLDELRAVIRRARSEEHTSELQSRENL